MGDYAKRLIAAIDTAFSGDFEASRMAVPYAWNWPSGL
jgi:hypothetical protein